MRGVLWNEMVNEYRLARESIKGKSFVMVEGKTDHALWTEYFPATHCYLVYADGKNDIVDALKTPVLRDSRGIAGIVDLDYWLITQADELGIKNLIYDKCCPDMESLLLNSDALKKLLRNHLYRFEIEKVHEFAEKLKAEAERLATEFGYFRLLDYIEDYRISFKKLWNRNRHGDFILIRENMTEFNREGFSLKLKEICPRISGIDLLKEVDELRHQYPPVNIQLCQGHDFVATTAYMLPILFKTEFNEDLSDSMKIAFEYRLLSANLRSAYEYGYFTETSLYTCIKSWECRNDGYKILKPVN